MGWKKWKKLRVILAEISPLDDELQTTNIQTFEQMDKQEWEKRIIETVNKSFPGFKKAIKALEDSRAHVQKSDYWGLLVFISYVSSQVWPVVLPTEEYAKSTLETVVSTLTKKR